MKNRVLFLFILLVQLPLLQAQDLTDGLRIGMDDLAGSARFISMGGAFGALGGDLSALKVNPAGSAVFLDNYGSFSLDINAFENKTNYTGQTNNYRNNNFDLNQAGIVFVFNNASEHADVTRISLGVNYDRTNTFKNKYNAIGGSGESISDMFLGYAQGIPLDFLTPYDDESLDELYSYLGSANIGFNNNRLQAAYLAYEGFLFDAVDENDFDQTDYVSNVSGNSFEHAYQLVEAGTKGKITFNGGLALADRVYLGLNLNSHFLDYRQSVYMDEFIADPSEINEISYDNYLDTRGTGFSVQVGGIVKLDEMWRVGLSYESPTWYRISDETNQFFRTYSNEFGEVLVNPMVTNVFPDYNMRTPGQLNASVATVFGGVGLLSFDYSYRDYSKTKFSSSGFSDINAEIKENLEAVNTFRVGGEFRVEGLRLRAGYRFEESPYVDNTLGDLQGYSAGLGYDFGAFKLDFAYDLAKRDYSDQLLHTQFTNRAFVKNTLSHYVLTLSFVL